MDFSFLPNKFNFFLHTHAFSDIYITDFGYNNLAKIKPFYHIRTQLNYTLHYIIGGSGELHFRDKVYYLKANDMFFLPPGEDFSYYPIQNDPWNYIWFGFNGTYAQSIAETINFNAQNPIYTCQSGIKIAEMLHTFMHNVYEKNNTNINFALGAFFNLVALVEYERNLKIKNDAAQTDYYVQKTKEIISLNYQNPTLTIEDLCSIVHLSHSYLCKIFKKISGQSIKNYLISLRMKKALELLEKETNTVKQIAYSVGYTDELYFSKEFKKFYNISPLKYKIKYINSKKTIT